MKSKRYLRNRNTESFNMKNDDKLICDSNISFVDQLHNRPEELNDIGVNINYEYFVDHIMSKQTQNTKFAIRLRNGEIDFHPKIFNSFSKIDLEAIKKEMSISEDSGGVFEIAKFENEELVVRLCVDMRGQPIHWEVMRRGV